ncbi:MAG: hypothetical protein KC589_07895 [Nanoarchaeota archaeon]|nr:hypothetical protein [Nanoarchaeota archaeon]
MAKAEIPDKIKEAISGVMDLLKSGNLPKAIAKATFPNVAKPFSAWSMSNKMLCAVDWIFTTYPEIKKIEDSKKRGEELGKHIFEALEKADYRGFAQWKEIKRYIKKGQRSTVSILAPSYKKYFSRYYIDDKGEKVDLKKDEKAPAGKEEKVENGRFISGFFGIPVFSSDQTEGQAIKYKKLELPKMPYMDVAKFLDIKVEAIGFKGRAYGSFTPSLNRIQLATPNQATFFHELAHAVDHYLLQKLGLKGLSMESKQYSEQEIVAQFSANVLAYIVGYEIEQTTAYTKSYIEHYKVSESPEQDLIRLLSRIEKIVEFIANFKGSESGTRKAEKIEGEPKDDVEKLADKPTEPESKPKPLVDKDANGIKDAQELANAGIEPTDQNIIDQNNLKGKEAQKVKGGEL